MAFQSHPQDVHNRLRLADGCRKYCAGDGSTDDMIIMPLQCGTQWDALSHVFLDGKLYNGYEASLISSDGAKRNG